MFENYQLLDHTADIGIRVKASSLKDLFKNAGLAITGISTEKHEISGKLKTLCVHRKGATRAFPPGHPDIPERYKTIGQPVIIPGDMGRNSYLLVGTQKAMDETFGSTCHGAGRLKSRSAALKAIRTDILLKELNSKGIIVKTSGRNTLAEEAPSAYKDVNDVVDVVHNAGIGKGVCRMWPLGVIKG